MPKNEVITIKDTDDAEKIQRWRWMLEQNIPIIGGWMHRRITSALTEAALTGNWLAAQSLAIVFVLHQDADVRKQAGETLRKVNYATGIDAVWGVWAETRHPGLEKIVVEYNRVAWHPASVRLLSVLRLSLLRPDLLSSITHGAAELVPPLIQACDDKDAQIAAQARTAVETLNNPTSIDAVCQTWASSRSEFLAEVIQKAKYVAHKPAAARVLSTLLTNQINLVMHSSAEMVAPLVAACADTDENIAVLARKCLPQLQNQPAVDEFCRLWSETRAPLLESALIQAGYIARSPTRVRLLAALKCGQRSIAEKITPPELAELLNATHDADPVIAENARAALGSLQNSETRDALCGRVIELDDPLAREVALQSQYAPSMPETRALFYFLTEQWDAYNELDFDQSILRAIYAASPQSDAGKPNLRQRIAARVQAAGRTDYLTILAGADYRARAEEVSPSEAALLIRVLAGNGEYARLWALAPELALPFSLEIMHILDEQHWRPSAESDQPVFDQLLALSREPILLVGEELTRVLPLAIPRTTLKVKGRVNEVAFSPTQPVLAIATSQRKVVLWNYRTAKIERVLSHFQHSVGKVNYMPDGTLVCAERTSTQALCSVYVQDENETILTYHLGSVTVLEPVGEDRLLTTGRDGQAFLWDLAQHKKVSDKEYPFWARSAAISPDHQYAALLHDRLSLVRLPDLTIVPGYPFLTPRAGAARRDSYRFGVAQNAAFSPDGKYLLAGQYNGMVGLYFHTSLTQRPPKAVVTLHSKPVRGINFLPGHPVVITAGAEGQVRFIRWPEMSLLGMALSPEGQLTSLRVSQRGAFMATGTNDASLVLWDLRAMDIPDLFSQPLATATHDQVTDVLALSEYHSLPEPVRNGLKFLRLLLQYRFRYDIQIEDAPMIQFGDFDIVLDEIS